jgi:hypothetical protein
MKKIQFKGMRVIDKETLKRIAGGSPSPGECIKAAKEIGLDPIRMCCPACNPV